MKRLSLKTCVDQGITLHIVGHAHPLAAHTQRARAELEVFHPNITVELVATSSDAPREAAGVLVENLMFKAALERPSSSCVRRSVLAHSANSATRSSSSSRLSGASGHQPLVQSQKQQQIEQLLELDFNFIGNWQ